MFAVTIALSVLISVLPANLAQDPMPTPIPTPGGESCYYFIHLAQPLRANDTTILAWTEPGISGGGTMYAFECLSQEPSCPIIGQVLGYAIAYSTGKWGDRADISLTRSLRKSEYIALYVGGTPPYCAWSVYQVSGAFLPRFYLPLLLGSSPYG